MGLNTIKHLLKQGMDTMPKEEKKDQFRKHQTSQKSKDILATYPHCNTPSTYEKEVKRKQTNLKN
jgi:hypothetical protein